MNAVVAIRPVKIRRPDPDETPLSTAEMWVAVREGIYAIQPVPSPARAFAREGWNTTRAVEAA